MIPHIGSLTKSILCIWFVIHLAPQIKFMKPWASCYQSFLSMDEEIWSSPAYTIWMEELGEYDFGMDTN